MGKAERTREMIIENAAVIFNKKGVAGTSVDDVLHAAKVAKGCLYGHFESKEALAHATVDYLISRVTVKAEAVMSKEKTALGKIAAFLTLYNNPVNHYIEGGCPILNFGVEADDTDAVIKRKVSNMISATSKILTEILKFGIDRGEFTSDLKPENQVFKMMTMLEGSMLLSRVLADNSKMDMIIEMILSELKGFANH